MNTTAILFSCQRCGFCCHGETTVSLDEDDQRRMIEALHLPAEEVKRRFWRVSGTVVQMRTVDGHCIFYENGCTIYHGRPWRCAQWPLVPALLVDEANRSAIADSCPGLNMTLAYDDFCRLFRRTVVPDNREPPERR